MQGMRDLPCQLWHSVLKTHIHIVDGEDLIIRTLFLGSACTAKAFGSRGPKAYIDQKQLGARLCQCPVRQEREFRRFLLECLLVVAEAEFVRQCTA